MAFGWDPRQELVAPLHLTKSIFCCSPWLHGQQVSILSFPSFSLHNVLCNPTDLIWWKGIPFEMITGCTVFINGLLAEVFQVFLQLQGKCQEICVQAPVSSHHHPYHWLTDMTDGKWPLARNLDRIL